MPEGLICKYLQSIRLYVLHELRGVINIFNSSLLDTRPSRPRGRFSLVGIVSIERMILVGMKIRMLYSSLIYPRTNTTPTFIK